MKRIRTGWQLTGKSWRLLRSHPVLLRYPLLGAVAAIPAGVLAAAGVYLIDTEEYVAGGAAFVAGTFVATFVISFFGVALAACADAVLHGRDADAGVGYGVARSRLGAIAGWSLISAFVGLALQLIETVGKGGEIVRALVGGAWSLITFLVIPVLAIEDVGPGTAVKRSGAVLKKKFLEEMTGIPVIGLAVFLFAILPAIGIIVLGVVLWIADNNGAELAAGGALVGIGVILLVIGALVQSALRGIFGVVLYRFAADDETLGGFGADELTAAVETGR